MAMLAYSPEDTARALGIPMAAMEEYMLDEEHPVFQAHWSGFYETDIALRDSIFKLAKAGSSPAQAMAQGYIIKSEIRRRL